MATKRTSMTPFGQVITFNKNRTAMTPFGYVASEQKLVVVGGVSIPVIMNSYRQRRV